jgi:hypothetical protein
MVDALKAFSLRPSANICINRYFKTTNNAQKKTILIARQTFQTQK